MYSTGAIDYHLAGLRLDLAVGLCVAEAKIEECWMAVVDGGT